MKHLYGTFTDNQVNETKNIFEILFISYCSV